MIPLEDSPGETYELVSPGGIRCGLYPIEISEFVVEHLSDGGEFQMVLIADEHTSVEYSPFGKEAEELRSGVEHIIAGAHAELDAGSIAQSLQELLNEVDARDSLHYLAKAENRKIKQDHGEEH